MDRSDLAWAAWLASTLGVFAVLETLAVKYGKLATLTHTLRRWMGLHPSRPHGRLVVAGFFGFWCWLVLHLLRWKGGNVADKFATTNVETGHGQVAVPLWLLDIWNRYGWPTDEVLRLMVHEPRWRAR